MRGHNLWSYAPYKPLLTEVGDIYICRVVPSKHSIHFEWLNTDRTYHVFYRKRSEKQFDYYQTVSVNECDILNLETETDYEFYVQSGEKKSRIRLARTGESVGVVVNYLHPDDGAYSFSGRYLCSPSLVKHPDGFLLASMDVYADKHPQNLTFIFRSDDNGETWHYVSELMPCFWGKMFMHKGELYMLSCSTEYGDLIIGKSTDGGKTFSAPVTLLRGSNGKNGNDGIHKNPQNIMIHNGRIYETLEWGTWENKEYGHAAMVMSCDVNDDLLVPENWSFTEPVMFDYFVPEIEDLKKPVMTIEGTLTLSLKGELLNIMRFGKCNYAIAYKVNTQNHDAPLEFKKLIHFEANFSKFMMKYDAVSKRYYSIGARIHDTSLPRARNLLSLMSSADLENWEVVCDLMDYRHCDPEKYGFQYADFEFDGDDIIYLCRTAINNPNNYHNSNYSTFHRIKNFRDL